MLTTKALKPLPAQAERTDSAARTNLTPATRNPFAPQHPRPTALQNPVAEPAPNPVRSLAFFTSLVMLFMRMGVIPELLYTWTGQDTYLLYLVAPPALLGAFAAGAFPRTFRLPAARYWALFFLWMIIATPFSYWIGGSVQKVIGYARVDFAMLFIIGGIAVSWGEIRKLSYALAAACLVTLAAVAKYGMAEDGRLHMDAVSGTIGNSNDLAAHLLLLLPFCGYVLQDRKLPFALRSMMVPVIGYGLWAVLRTGSRGALIAVGVMTLFILIRASAAQRLLALVTTLALALSLPAILPEATMNRLSSLFGTTEHREADESAGSREYLFWKSVDYTFQFPVFGVGPEQFPNYEGAESRREGKHGSWHQTHNTFTQISSECGIPALLLFVAGLVSSFRLVSNVYRKARAAGHADLANLSFYYMLSMVGFLSASLFLSHGYTFRFPAMIGFAIALHLCGQPYLAAAPIGSRPQPFAPIPR